MQRASLSLDQEETSGSGDLIEKWIAPNVPKPSQAYALIEIIISCMYEHHTLPSGHTEPSQLSIASLSTKISMHLEDSLTTNSIKKLRLHFPPSNAAECILRSDFRCRDCASFAQRVIIL